jgi:hypothetical protein
MRVAYSLSSCAAAPLHDLASLIVTRSFMRAAFYEHQGPAREVFPHWRATNARARSVGKLESGYAPRASTHPTGKSEREALVAG